MPTGAVTGIKDKTVPIPTTTFPIKLPIAPI
jgi:hypothetical protein